VNESQSIHIPIPTPKRRWFRFSLRTLFVVVTVIACWMGYQLNWIRQRHEFVGQRLAPVGHSLYPRLVRTDGVAAEAPRTLRLFGERGYAHISIDVFQAGLEHPPDDRRELKMARRLFPEAQLECTISRDND
jgi:hypothetical protein